MNNQYTRQYIGARYVPKFFNNPNGTWEWLEGIQYEPLTIVKYAENTYTSKKLVPSNIGSPNINQEYWANTGNYNGAILELQNEIQTKAPNLKFKNQKILIFCDSYGTTVNNQQPFTIILSNFLTKLGAIVTVNALAGSGLTSENVPNYYQRLSSIGYNEYDYIFIEGFANDGSKSDNILISAVNNLSILLNNFSSNIYILPLSKGYIYNYNPSITAIISQFEKNGFVVLDSRNLINNKNLLQSDGIHLTAEGGGTIATNIFQLINGNAPKLTYYPIISYNIETIIYGKYDKLGFIQANLKSIVQFFINLSTPKNTEITLGESVSFLNENFTFEFLYMNIAVKINIVNNAVSAEWDGQSLPNANDLKTSYQQILFNSYKYMF